LYRDASLGNAISIVVSRIIVLTEDQVSGIFAADVHLYYLPTASAAASASASAAAAVVIVFIQLIFADRNC
jgi:hypothetical protein